MATLFTYDVGFAAGSGNREDLSDLVINIDPTDTPLFTMIPKGEAYHTTHDWLTDSLAATSTGGLLEGHTFSSASLTSRTRQTNWTQIFGKDIDVSNTQRAVNPAGVEDEYTHQIEKALAEKSRDVEVVLLSAAGGSATGATGTIRHMKNIADFVTANAFHCDATAIGGDGVSTATAHTLLEDQFNGGLEQAFIDGGKPDTVLLSPKAKRQVSKNFAGIQNKSQNIDAMDKRLVNAIDFYDSDFGLVKLVLDRWVPQMTGTAATDTSGMVFMLEMQNLSLDFLRPFQHIPLAPGGDSTRGMVLGELTLKVGHPDAHVILTAVSSAIATA